MPASTRAGRGDAPGCAARLANVAKEPEAGGWKWVETMQESYIGYYEMEQRKLDRLYREEGVLTEEQTAAALMVTITYGYVLWWQRRPAATEPLTVAWSRFPAGGRVIWVSGLRSRLGTAGTGRQSELLPGGRSAAFLGRASNDDPRVLSNSGRYGNGAAVISDHLLVQLFLERARQAQCSARGEVQPRGRRKQVATLGMSGSFSRRAGAPSKPIKAQHTSVSG